ncbi:DUF6035 domain-containing protein [Mucilaginibacter galii]|uniref:Competence protein n=1 Tax=Mucilaginibacter galii TaxID=2005073 RepID=A0A917N319_9SPHI|nr:DUF6035 family protein [Mucilaginibacter galii]GGI52685.1 hypothetical protein GCM10011425_38970 [Mucilaginibacter galii]
MGYERAINLAYDEVADEILNAENIFRSAKDSFEIRRQYHTGEIKLSCVECRQTLGVSTSKYDRLFFKHHPNADYCILKDESLTPYEMFQLDELHKFRESDRHKFLKSKIAQLLKDEDGVDPASVIADKKFFFSGKEKRRPDVYAIFRNRQLVFEIQLSNLPLKYILDRYNFYKDKGMYLIWILDDFDVQSQTQMVRDVKYLNSYHNFFNLDENAKAFGLSCTYKKPVINSKEQIVTPWIKETVRLQCLRFDPETVQAYYFDFELEKRLQEQRLREIIAERKASEEKQRELELQQESEFKANHIIKEIARYKRLGWSYHDFDEKFDDMDEYDLDNLNRLLGFNEKCKDGKPLFNYYFATLKKGEHNFGSFLMNEKRIEVNVDLIDNGGNTIFHDLIRNDNLIYKYGLIKGLLKRGYQLQPEDFKLYNERGRNTPLETEAELLLFEFACKVKQPYLIDTLYYHDRVFFTIASAKEGKMINFRLKGFKNLAINAISNYQKHWVYLELAFKHYGVWNEIINNDTKDTFKKKLANFYGSMPVQDHSIDKAVKILFPELFR